MTRRRFLPLAAALAALLLAAALPAAAQAPPPPNWPENGRLYACSYTLGNGAQETRVATFSQLQAESHKFGDGNELKRGRLIQYIRSYWNPQTVLDQRVTLAYKPLELPSPSPGASRIELTVNGAGIQCKNFINFADINLHFGQCSNGTVMNCTRCGFFFGRCP